MQDVPILQTMNQDTALQVICSWPERRNGYSGHDRGWLELLSAGAAYERVSTNISLGKQVPGANDDVHMRKGVCTGPTFGKPKHLHAWVAHYASLGFDGLHVYTYAGKWDLHRLLKPRFASSRAQ